MKEPTWREVSFYLTRLNERLVKFGETQKIIENEREINLYSYRKKIYGHQN